MRFDASIFNFIHYLSGKWWPLDWLGIFIAEYLPYFLIVAAIYLLIKEKNNSRRIYVFALMSLSVILSRGIITEIISFFYHRVRPFSVMNFTPLISPGDAFDSFPSGHSAAFFALAAAVFFFDRRSGKWFFILSSLIAIARVFVGVHWPLDILGGAIIGILSAFLVKIVIPRRDDKTVSGD